MATTPLLTENTPKAIDVSDAGAVGFMSKRRHQGETLLGLTRATCKRILIDDRLAEIRHIIIHKVSIIRTLRFRWGGRFVVIG